MLKKDDPGSSRTYSAMIGIMKKIGLLDLLTEFIKEVKNSCSSDKASAYLYIPEDTKGLPKSFTTIEDKKITIYKILKDIAYGDAGRVYNAVRINATTTTPVAVKIDYGNVFKPNDRNLNAGVLTVMGYQKHNEGGITKVLGHGLAKTIDDGPIRRITIMELELPFGHGPLGRGKLTPKQIDEVLKNLFDGLIKLDKDGLCQLDPKSYNLCGTRGHEGPGPLKWCDLDLIRECSPNGPDSAKHLFMTLWSVLTQLYSSPKPNEEPLFNAFRDYLSELSAKFNSTRDLASYRETFLCNLERFIYTIGKSRAGTLDLRQDSKHSYPDPKCEMGFNLREHMFRPGCNAALCSCVTRLVARHLIAAGLQENNVKTVQNIIYSLLISYLCGSTPLFFVTLLPNELSNRAGLSEAWAKKIAYAVFICMSIGSSLFTGGGVIYSGGLILSRFLSTLIGQIIGSWGADKLYSVTSRVTSLVPSQCNIL